MVGELRDGLVKVVVQAVDGVLFLRRETAQVPLPHEKPAQRLADGRVVREKLGDDVVCALQGVGDCFHAVFGDDEVRGGVLRARAGALLRIEQLRQRLKPLLAGGGRAGAALLLIGAVEILHLRERRGRVNGGGELRRELALSVDGLFDLLTALVKTAQIRQAIRELSEGCVVHGAVLLLAVAGDEGDGVALVEQGDDIFHIRLRTPQLAGENFRNGGHRSILSEKIQGRTKVSAPYNNSSSCLTEFASPQRREVSQASKAGRGAQRSETPHSKRAVPVLSAFFTYGTAACSRTSAHS